MRSPPPTPPLAGRQEGRRGVYVLLLLAGFWAGFNLAKYATKCCLFHIVHWPVCLAACLLLSCFLLLAFILVYKLWLNDSLDAPPPQKGVLE